MTALGARRHAILMPRIPGWAGRAPWLVLAAVACQQPDSGGLCSPAVTLPSPTPSGPARPSPNQAEPAQICVPSPEGIPALRGEAPPPYQVKLPECGQALGPVEVEGFDR